MRAAAAAAACLMLLLSPSFVTVKPNLNPSTVLSFSSSSTKPKTSSSTTLQSFLSNRRVSFLFPSIMDSSPENPNPLPLYKTLPLTLLSPPPSPNQSPADPHPPYTVFRSDLSLCAAADFFSLDVGVDADPQTPKTLPPTKKIRLQTPDPTLWFRGNSRFRSPMLQLHKEIVDFCDFLSPTQEEESSRNTAVQSVFQVIRYIWPNCWVEVFGSFKTGLYLPTSDIDVVILQSGITKPQMGLYALSKALSQKGIAKNIQVIAKARVPIIKFVEKISGFSFDISFDATNGPKAANFIKDAISKWPPLRPLCLVLKVFLQQRKLNEVYSGGIGSYALLAMLIAMLQNLKEHEASLERNLGILLIHFFDIYGRKLNTTDVGVSCRGTGTFFLKRKKGFINKARPFLIAIEDPQAPENDIGKNSFNYFQIRSAFAMAFSMLTNPMTILGLDPNRSILGTIIRRDPVLLERKGGRNGEMTFTSLLPGAGEPLLTPNGNDSGMLCSWQLDDEEEEVPWGSGICEDSSGLSSGKKRKGVPKEKSGKKKVKIGVARKLKQEEESGSSKEKAVKRRHRRGQQLSY